jgi:hypothetical protein
MAFERGCLESKQICQSEPVEDEQICLPAIAYFDRLNMTIVGAFETASFF